MLRRGAVLRQTQDFNASTSGVNLGVNDASQNVLAQTWMALVYFEGAGENNFNYVFSKTDASLGNGPKFGINDANACVFAGAETTGTPTGPVRNGAISQFQYNRWAYIAGSWSGGIAASSIKLYYAGLQEPLIETSYTGATEGTGSVVATAGNDIIIGDRATLNRTANGTIAFVARWNRVLHVDELRRAQRFGPLSVRAGLLMCWANGRDYGPNRLRPKSITAIAQGRRPQRRVLGFTGRTVFFASTVPPQLLAPASDISAGAWLPSTGTDLFAMIDESSASDADYDYTDSLSTMEVKFAAGSDPSSSGGHVLRYRLRGDGTTDAVVTLKQGTTTIATWTETNVPTSATTFEHTLSGAEADSITDYTNLRLSVQAA